MRSSDTPGSDFLLCLGDKRHNPSCMSLRLLHVWIPAESAGNTEKQKPREVHGNSPGHRDRKQI